MVLLEPLENVSAEAESLLGIDSQRCDQRIMGALLADERHSRGVYEIDPLRDPRWPELTECHRRASLFHDKRWLAALRTAYGYDAIAFSTCAPHEPLTNGLVFCQIKSWLTGRRLVSLPFSDHCEPLVETPATLDRLLLQARRNAEEGSCRYVEIRPVSCVPGDQVGLVRTKAYCFHRLDVRKSPEELFGNFHKDCVQRTIRRAERESLAYEDGNSEALLKKFYRLLVMTRRRQHLPPQPISWFRALVGSFGEDLKIRVASKGSMPIASILTICHKKVVTYKYGCSDAGFHKLGGTALLFWKTIQEAKDGGIEELDMGRSDADNAGLVAFKDHWGAAQSVLNYWQSPTSLRGLHSPGKMKLLSGIVTIAPDVALTAAGRLLYRHIG